MSLCYVYSHLNLRSVPPNDRIRDMFLIVLPHSDSYSHLFFLMNCYHLSYLLCECVLIKCFALMFLFYENLAIQRYAQALGGCSDPVYRSPVEETNIIVGHFQVDGIPTETITHSVLEAVANAALLVAKIRDV